MFILRWRSLVSKAKTQLGLCVNAVSMKITHNINVEISIGNNCQKRIKYCESWKLFPWEILSTEHFHIILKAS